jgi:signal transduction histidine kinase
VTAHSGAGGRAWPRHCGPWARRAALAVELDIAVEHRLPESIEVTAYYVVAEALTNAAQHAQASVVTVSADVDDEALHVSVADDGVGGVSAGGGRD